MIPYTVTESITRLRLTDYLIKFSESVLGYSYSRNYIKKIIKTGCIKIDGVTADTAFWVKPGQIIQYIEPDRKPVKIYKISFPVIYEDEFLAVINKPAGIKVSGNCFRTVENALLNNITPSLLPEALTQPRPVHRLDSLTSGLLLIAKTHPVRITLGTMLARHLISKTYQAIVTGKTPLSNSITSPLQSKTAITNYKRLRLVPSLRDKWLSLLELKPQTGRTHQLRIHLSQSGYPILGDKLYGTPGNIFKGKGLFLSATGLLFDHPVTGKRINLIINPPPKFDIHLNRTEKRYYSLSQ